MCQRQTNGSERDNTRVRPHSTRPQQQKKRDLLLTCFSFGGTMSWFVALTTATSISCVSVREAGRKQAKGEPKIPALVVCVVDEGKSRAKRRNTRGRATYLVRLLASKLGRDDKRRVSKRSEARSPLLGRHASVRSAFGFLSRSTSLVCFADLETPRQNSSSPFSNRPQSRERNTLTSRILVVVPQKMGGSHNSKDSPVENKCNNPR